MLANETGAALVLEGGDNSVVVCGNRTWLAGTPVATLAGAPTPDLVQSGGTVSPKVVGMAVVVVVLSVAVVVVVVVVMVGLVAVPAEDIVAEVSPGPLVELHRSIAVDILEVSVCAIVMGTGVEMFAWFTETCLSCGASSCFCCDEFDSPTRAERGIGVSVVVPLRAPSMGVVGGSFKLLELTAG